MNEFKRLCYKRIWEGFLTGNSHKVLIYVNSLKDYEELEQRFYYSSFQEHILLTEGVFDGNF